MTTTASDRKRIAELEENMRCAGCGRRPEQIGGYVISTIQEFMPEPPPDLDEAKYAEFAAAHWAAASQEERTAALRRYVRLTEGTLNPRTGAFACDECYVIAGMPSRPEGFCIPDNATWPLHSALFKEHAERKGMKVPSNPEDY